MLSLESRVQRRWFSRWHQCFEFSSVICTLLVRWWEVCFSYL